MKKNILTLFAFFIVQFSLFGQYKLIFEDDFNGDKLNPDNWNIEQNIGIWNTGNNRELEHYKKENVMVGPDSAGNQCLIITARREDYNGYAFTSGKVSTKNKLAVKYGRIESRLKLPNLANGLWPAFWLMGNSDLGWPACGEIDVMEAGNKDGITQNLQNRHFGGALHWDNTGSQADWAMTMNALTGLNTSYHTFTLDWTPTVIKMYLDSSQTAYYTMDITGTNAEEFRDYEYYIIFNLSVGGIFPDIYTPDGITAPMPATMYVDYIKIYQKEGEGSFNNNMPVIGDLAVFADGQTYENYLDMGYDGTIFSENLTTREGETPREGTSVLSYNYSTTGEPFLLKLESSGIKNMSGFISSGSLDFYIKTMLTGKLQVGIADSAGLECWISLNDTLATNPLRDETWQRVVVPLKNFQNIDFSAIKDLIMLKGVSDAEGYLSLDKVIWSTSTVDFNYFGIFTDNPAITERFVIDNITNNVFVWENSMLAIPDAPSYDGTNVLAFQSDASKTWYGFGINAANGMDFTQFSNGYLKFALRTSSSKDFWIGMGGAGSTEAKIDFKNGSDPYGFIRDGKWHSITIPMSDLLTLGIDLTSCGNIFMLGGAPSISDILIDDIYLSQVPSDFTNEALNPDRDNSLNLPDNSIKADYWGLYTENPNITEKFVLDNVTGHIYIWNNTMVSTPITSTYEGSGALQFRSNGSAGWYGFGVFSDKSVNLLHFSTGYLSLALKTSSKNEFYVAVAGAANSQGKITFKNGSDPYGFVRDGKWHHILIPISTLTAQGLDLSACGNIFILGGTTITDIGIDDIVFGVDNNFPDNPGVHIQPNELTENELAYVQVFPNPVSAVLTLLSDDQSEINDIKISDLTGRVMLSIVPEYGTIHQQVEVSGLPAGMYIIVVKTSKWCLTKRFVKE